MSLLFCCTALFPTLRELFVYHTTVALLNIILLFIKEYWVSGKVHYENGFCLWKIIRKLDLINDAKLIGKILKPEKMI